MSLDVDAGSEGAGASESDVVDASALGADEHRPRIPLGAIARDPFFRFRLVALVAYGVAYVWWFRNKGLIVDRISVALSVAVFLACAFAGKPWRRWATLLVDSVLYSLMWFGYEMTRGAADGLGLPLQVEAPRNIDRFLFFGTDPNVWMQRRFYHAADIKWYDNIASATYCTHFVFPVIAMAVLWAASRVQWVRFMKRFATLLGAGCVMFVLIPTAPPWMVARTRPLRIGGEVHQFGQLPPISRHTSRGFVDLGFTRFSETWQDALDWTNAVAAMPSLHSAFALFVPAFFLPWIRSRWLKGVVLVFPVMMLTSLVYFGEHWVIDGLVGWALVGGSFLFWNRMERRQRRRRAGRARSALDVISGSLTRERATAMSAP